MHTSCFRAHVQIFMRHGHAATGRERCKTLVRDDRRSQDFTLGTLSRRNANTPERSHCNIVTTRDGATRRLRVASTLPLSLHTWGCELHLTRHVQAALRCRGRGLARQLGTRPLSSHYSTAHDLRLSTCEHRPSSPSRALDGGSTPSASAACCAWLVASCAVLRSACELFVSSSAPGHGRRTAG